MSALLDKLYSEYKIDTLSPGRLGDSLGDLYEEYTKRIFLDERNIDCFNKRRGSTIEEMVFSRICAPYVDRVHKVCIQEVPKRESGGEPKTDLAVLVNGEKSIKLSIKQSIARQVSAAEFSVDTIREELSISNVQLITLLEKFQRDSSAINFSKEEKEQMKYLMRNVKNKFVRWVLSGAPGKDTNDLRVANHILMYRLDKKDRLLMSFGSHPLEEHIQSIVKSSAGFGTGLSWTYATGSKGKKIQFKCPVI